MEIQTLFKFCLTLFLSPERPGRLDTGHSNIFPTLFSFISFIHTLFLLKSSFRLCSTVVQIQTYVCVSTGSQTQITFRSVFVHIQTLFSICSHSLYIRSASATMLASAMMSAVLSLLRAPTTFVM